MPDRWEFYVGLGGVFVVGAVLGLLAGLAAAVCMCYGLWWAGGFK